MLIKQYIKSAIRNLLKRKQYSIIHILGLVLGMTTCLLLAAYIITEFSYDKMHKKGSYIFRVNTDLILPDQQLALSVSSGLVGPSMKHDFPEVSEFTRISSTQVKPSVRNGEYSFFENDFVYVDPGFLNMFSYTLLEGDPKSALIATNQIVLTESIAKKYFGDQHPVGNTLTIDNELFTITGLVADPPANSHLKFKALISYATWVMRYPPTETNWGWHPATTYISLHSGTDHFALSQKLNDWRKQKTPDEQNNETKLSLEPFYDIHFGEPRLGDLQPVSNKTQVLFLALTGVFILLLALFNYINLATAVYTDRAKEIGIRKTFGADRKQISFQFLTESVLLCFTAVTVSIILAHFLMPYFNGLVNQNMNLIFLSPLVILFVLLICVLIVGPLAGIYPALILSRLKPTAIFKDKTGNALGKIMIRRMLTSIQFIISTGLIICTLVIWQQQRYMMEKNLGFAGKNKLFIRMGNTAEFSRTPESIKQALATLPEVSGVSLSSHVPGENMHGLSTTVIKEDGSEANAEMELNLVDYDFLDLYQIKLIAGRKFSTNFSEDSTGALILNETAVKQLGFQNPESIIGRNFSQWGREGKVIGVVKDYNQHSLQSEIGPVTFQVNPELFEKITISYNTGNIPALITKLSTTWKDLTNNAPFDYSFLDEWITKQYDAERRFSVLFITFSILAIFIACLGLYGLTAVNVKKRIREIGVRKVLGATIPGLLKLLLNETFSLILISILIASPVAWLIMNSWLKNFAYRINLSWWVFLAAGIFTALIALITAGIYTAKAAIANPVKSLRTE